MINKKHLLPIGLVSLGISIIFSRFSETIYVGGFSRGTISWVRNDGFSSLLGLFRKEES